MRAQGMGLSAIAIAVESCKRLESSLRDCLVLLLVSYTLGLIVDRGTARARSSLLLCA